MNRYRYRHINIRGRAVPRKGSKRGGSLLSKASNSGGVSKASGSR